MNPSPSSISRPFHGLQFIVVSDPTDKIGGLLSVVGCADFWGTALEDFAG